MSGAYLVLGVVLVEPDNLPLFEGVNDVHDVIRFDDDVLIVQALSRPTIGVYPCFALNWRLLVYQVNAAACACVSLVHTVGSMMQP